MTLLNKHQETQQQLFDHVGWSFIRKYRIIGHTRYSWEIEKDHIKVFEKDDICCRPFYYEIYKDNIDGYEFRGEEITMILVLLENEVCCFFGDNRMEIK